MGITRPPRRQRIRIDSALRSAILRYADDRAKCSATAVFDAYREDEFYASISAAIDGIAERYGIEDGRLQRAYVAGVTARGEHGELAVASYEVPVDLGIDADQRKQLRWAHAHGANVFLAICPDEEFLTALEAADRRIYERRASPRTGRPKGSWPSTLAYANRVFESHGVPWIAKDGRFEWIGDSSTRAVVLEPALDALAAPDHVTARGEFGRAMRSLRRGGGEANEQAVLEAAKAVESTMQIVLKHRGIQPPARLNAQSVWQTLVAADVLPTWSESLVLAAARIRNHAGGHGAGTQPRHITQATAQASVGAAAVAITFLCSKLQPALDTAPSPSP